MESCLIVELIGARYSLQIYCSSLGKHNAISHNRRFSQGHSSPKKRPRSLACWFAALVEKMVVLKMGADDGRRRLEIVLQIESNDARRKRCRASQKLDSRAL